MSNVDTFLESQFGEATTSIARDLSLNFKKILEDSTNLNEEERFLNLLAIATSLHHKPMMALAEQELKTRDLTAEMIQEGKEIAGIMGMLNTYYKFKSYLSPEVLDQYSRAGLRMQSLMKPVNGKERFEQMSMSVSVINGCPTCISSHEKALAQLGVPAEKIHDLARLASVAKGISVFATIN